MNQEHKMISDEKLMAYVDGQLTAADRQTVEAFVAQNPEAAAKLAEFQRQSDSIEALFGHVAAEPVPERLKPSQIKAMNDNALPWRQIAAALVLVMGGAFAGWVGHGLTNQADASGTLIAEAFAAHELFTSQGRHTVEVGADEQDHLTTWLSKSLDRRLVIPQQLPGQFTLIGGRLLPAGTGSAAQIMYETADGNRVTLYLTPKSDTDPKANRFAFADNLDALYWANDAVTCTIVGDITRAQMEDIAGAVFKSLSWQDSEYRSQI